MKTLSYELGSIEEIEIGKTYYLGQLWDGEDGDAQELLDSEAICVNYEDNIIAQFVILEKAEDLLKTLVKVTDLY